MRDVSARLAMREVIESQPPYSESWRQAIELVTDSICADSQEVLKRYYLEQLTDKVPLKIKHELYVLLEDYLPKAVARHVLVDVIYLWGLPSLLVKVAVPRFKHDCDQCTYLGCYKLRDLYACNKTGYLTFITRYGSEPQDYTSILYSLAVYQDEYSAEAQRRWRLEN